MVGPYTKIGNTRVKAVWEEGGEFEILKSRLPMNIPVKILPHKRIHIYNSKDVHI